MGSVRCKTNGYVLVLSRYLQPKQHRMVTKAMRMAASEDWSKRFLTTEDTEITEGVFF